MQQLEVFYKAGGDKKRASFDLETVTDVYAQNPHGNCPTAPGCVVVMDVFGEEQKVVLPSVPAMAFGTYMAQLWPAGVKVVLDLADGEFYEEITDESNLDPPGMEEQYDQEVHVPTKEGVEEWAGQTIMVTGLEPPDDPYTYRLFRVHVWRHPVSNELYSLYKPVPAKGDEWIAIGPAFVEEEDDEDGEETAYQ